MVRAFTECVTLFAGSLDISIKATNNTSVCACVWKRRDKIGIFHRMKLFKKFIIFGCARSSLLFQLFSSCRERGPLLSCGVWASRSPMLLQSTGPRVWAQNLCSTGALRHVESSWM